MTTQEIPRDDWSQFLDKFSGQHEGWLASLEVFATDLGAQVEVRERSFEGIAIASSVNGSETIAISLGKSPEDHLTHTIAKPKRVWLEQTAAGANAALEIESQDETKTLLRFRSALPPEMVDGALLT